MLMILRSCEVRWFRRQARDEEAAVHMSQVAYNSPLGTRLC